MINIRTWIRERVSEVVQDEEKRYQLQMVWVFRIVGIIALAMTVVNLLTREFYAGMLTSGFMVLSLLCAALIDRFPRWRRTFAMVMITALIGLIAWFIISGEPEGFSPIWICIVPSAALLLLGRWRGGSVCLALFVVVVFLMWTPWGRGLLRHEYAESFLTRLPLVYVAAFWLSWFLEYVREVTQKQLVQTQLRLSHLYRHDALTGVLNRYGFNEYITRAAKQEHPEGLALMIIDLDDFKHTNDTYGHPAGDAVLREMAQTISRVIGVDGELSRWGGEEFAVLMERSSGAMDMAQALRAAIAAMRVSYGKATVQVTVSIGLTVCTEMQVNAERLVTCSDIGLYRAKKNGKNQVVCVEYSEEA